MGRLLAGLVVASILLVGCTGGGGTAAPSGDTSSGALAPPGLYEQDDGTTQALGLLTYRNLEGGFWAVVDTAVPEEADTAKIVAVIVPGDDVASKLEELRYEYVSVIGKRNDGPSIYQAGPVIEATSVEAVKETEVK